MTANTARIAIADPIQWEQVVAAAVLRSQSQIIQPKQSRSRDRHAEILEAAVRVFAREGIAQARISDIAAEAGVPLSSVYDYYSSKESIAYVVPISRMGEFIVEFQGKAAKCQNAAGRLYLFMWLTVDFARRNQDWARTLYLEIWPSVMVNKTRVKHSLDDYARVMLALIQDGELTGEWTIDGDLYETFTIFIGSLSQLIITWLMYKRPRHLMKATVSIVRRLMASQLQLSLPSDAPVAPQASAVRSANFSRTPSA